MDQKATWTALAGLLLLLSVAALLFGIEQDQFPRILLAYSTGFIGFYGLIKNKIGIVGIIIIALATRCMALLSFPALSDDIYRYIWDGLQWSQGNNPFAYLPINQPHPSDYENMLIRLMNSPHYHSIYPPVLQLLFFGVTDTIAAPLIKQTFLLKGIVLFVETIGMIATYFLLKKWKLPVSRIALYALNPLIIVELLGNLHLEIIMIAFLAIALLCFSYRRYILMGLVLSLSVLSKLTTLLILPFLYKKTDIRTFLKIVGTTMTCVILSFYLMLSGTLENFLTSLNLYFQKFEFNASIYFFFRFIGKSIIGYNPIYVLGPLLSVISASMILYFAHIQKKTKNIQDAIPYILFALTCYFLLSTTVHPWYISTLVFLSIFTRYSYVQYWSYLAVFSYSLYYLDGAYYYGAITLEYLILAYFIVKELRTNHKVLFKQ